MKKTVITIARSYGSGGKTLGNLLAKDLGINCYSREILRMASDESGINEALFGEVDEKMKKSPLLFNILKKNPYKGGVLPPESSDFVSDDNLFNYQAKVIKDLAAQESCIIIGRCADYVLKDNPDVISVFCYSDVEERIQWSIDEYQVPAKQAKKIVQEKDAQRSRFYEFYTNQKWGNPRNYTLMINTSKMSTEETVQLLASFYDAKKGILTFKNAFENQYEKDNKY